MLQLAGASPEFWDLSPIKYSETAATDPVSLLARRLTEQPLEPMPALDRLRYVLKELNVPESSQILVFSKTSKQIGLIGPRNPRALYYSENVYVGYVPGGAIEVIAEDPILGPVFYLIKGDSQHGMVVTRDSSDCFSCHATTRTNGVPGMFVRSVYPDADGHIIGSLGSETVTHETPIKDRWGGYYVTGKSALPHLGNRIFSEDGALPEPAQQSLQSLENTIETGKYLLPTSDIVSLMVLEHQCLVHNLLTDAKLRYRRAAYLAKAISPDEDPDEGQAGRMADSAARKIVDALLFKDEADLGDGVDGSEEFMADFSSRYPTDERGKSLTNFRLYHRLFKYRCSYMIYSQAFASLPARVKSAVYDRLEDALSEEDEAIAPWLGGREKTTIRRILKETLADWPMEE